MCPAFYPPVKEAKYGQVKKKQKMMATCPSFIFLCISFFSVVNSPACLSNLALIFCRFCKDASLLWSLALNELEQSE